MKRIVDELDGYLHSLRRLAKDNCDYWATHIKVENEDNVEQAIHQHFAKAHIKTEVTGIKKVNYTTIKKFFNKFIIEQLTTNTEDQVYMLIWDIVEYYGLASTTVNPEGPFNPLVSEGALEITVKQEDAFHKELVYFLVQIENQAILTGFGIRA